MTSTLENFVNDFIWDDTPWDHNIYEKHVMLHGAVLMMKISPHSSSR